MPRYTSMNFIMAVATIRREHRVPADGVRPDVKVQMGQHVSTDDLLIQASRAGHYQAVPLLDGLKIRRVSDLKSEWILVSEGDQLEAGQTIAQKGARGPKVLAPVACVVASVDESAAQIVIQDSPEPVTVRALYPGTITDINNKGMVQVESYGVLIQCAWGNGRSAAGAYLQEPAEGMRQDADVLGSHPLRGQLLWLNRLLVAADLTAIEQQEMLGVIAPGMPASMIAAAKAAPFAICLTEGFGISRYSDQIYGLLRDNLGREIAMDAVLPGLESIRKPELFIGVRAGGLVPPTPLLDRPLSPGATVRISREPFVGLTGQIEQVAETPQIVDNELRLPGAIVQLKDGRQVFVPAANLELLG